MYIYTYIYIYIYILLLQFINLYYTKFKNCTLFFNAYFLHCNGQSKKVHCFETLYLRTSCFSDVNSTFSCERFLYTFFPNKY